jgi:hypothetical protein
MISQDTLAGLAFPVVRVRYTGNGYAASLYKDVNETVRASVGYDHALSPSANALEAARKCWDKYTAQHDTHEPSIFIPGNLDSSHYSFTVVPAYFFKD